ncbi:hypothetical protein Tco_1525628 [Tanacetum coccineum]
MTSFDYRLNRLKTIKECSLCGALYTSDYCCSKEGIVDKIIRELPSPSCARCGTPVDGPQCRGCALLRKKFKEDLFTYCVENGIFQDLQDTSESSDDNTNVVNAPQEPFVVKQDPDHKPALYTDEPALSLIIEDEHLDTIPETESDEFIKSSVENLVQDPSESEGEWNSSREEIDIFFGPEDSIPPGIESDDFDSEDDNNSTFLPEFESFHVDYPDSGDSTIDVVEDIPVNVPNILPTHPALHLDFDFIPSHNNLGSNLDDSSPSGDRNKTYDPGICIKVESMKSLAAHSSVIDTSLPFSSENEVKVFNHDDLSIEEKSPQSSSHCDSKAFQLSSDSPMLILGANTPHLSVRQVHFYPP